MKLIKLIKNRKVIIHTFDDHSYERWNVEFDLSNLLFAFAFVFGLEFVLEFVRFEDDVDDDVEDDVRLVEFV